MKVCSTPGCPTLVTKGKCHPCTTATRAARGTTTQQGYGWSHQQRRARLLAELTPGTPCPRCGTPMQPTDALDAGHTTSLAADQHAIADRIECSSCNRAAGGRLSQAMRVR